MRLKKRKIPKQVLALAVAGAVTVGAPLGALADTYDLTKGNITVTVEKRTDGGENVWVKQEKTETVKDDATGEETKTKTEYLSEEATKELKKAKEDQEPTDGGSGEQPEQTQDGGQQADGDSGEQDEKQAEVPKTADNTNITKIGYTENQSKEEKEQEEDAAVKKAETENANKQEETPASRVYDAVKGLLQTSAVKIWQNDSAKTSTGNTVTIKAEADTETEVTLDSVNIAIEGTSEETPSAPVSVDVAEGAKVDIELDGDSTLKYSTTSGYGKGEHASLEMTGDGELEIRDQHQVLKEDGTVETNADNAAGSLTVVNGTAAACIGTNVNQDLTGTLTISGGTINVTDARENNNNTADGAGIGTGDSGNIAKTGSIHITGTANVTSKRRNGAAVGTGQGHYTTPDKNGERKEQGFIQGEIKIDGAANVTASSYGFAAGIGTGMYAGIDGGSITIDTTGDVVGVSKYAAGIGTGTYIAGPTEGAEFGINGGTSGVLTEAGNVDIRNGGKIEISNGKVIGASGYTLENNELKQWKINSWSAGIGTSRKGSITDGGSVILSGTANVTGVSSCYGAGIGTGYLGDIKNNGSITVSKEATASGIGGLFGAGIGTGYQGNITQGGGIHITGGKTVEGDSYAGAGIGTGYQGNITQGGGIHITGGKTVTGTSQDEGAGIGTGSQGSLAGTISIQTADGTTVTANGGYAGAGIGTGTYGGFTGEISLTGTGGRIEAFGGRYGAAIGTGDVFYTPQSGNVVSKANTAGSIVIDTKGTVYALAGAQASAIGGGRSTDTVKNQVQKISILNAGALYAYADGTKFAVDLNTDDLTETKNVLNGRFVDNTGDGTGPRDESANGLTSITDTRFVVVDERGNVVERFTLPAYQGGTGSSEYAALMYNSFAVSTNGKSASGRYFVFNEDGLYKNNIAGTDIYQNYGAGWTNNNGSAALNGGRHVRYDVSGTGMLIADEMQFPNAKVTYAFQSATAGKTLPAGVLAQLYENTEQNVFTLEDLKKLFTPGTVFASVEDDGGTWTFERWTPEAADLLSENGDILDRDFVGTWVWTKDAEKPDPTPTPGPDPDPKPGPDPLIPVPEIPADPGTPAEPAAPAKAAHSLPQTGTPWAQAAALAAAGLTLGLSSLLGKGKRGKHEKR